MRGQQQSGMRRLNKHWQSGDSAGDGLIPLPSNLFGDDLAQSYYFSGLRYDGSDKWVALNYHDSLATLNEENTGSAYNGRSYYDDSVYYNAPVIMAKHLHSKTNGRDYYASIRGPVKSTLYPKSWPMKHVTTPGATTAYFNIPTMEVAHYDNELKYWKKYEGYSVLQGPYDNPAQLLQFETLVYFYDYSEGYKDATLDYEETDNEKLETEYRNKLYKLLFRIPKSLKDCEMLFLPQFGTTGAWNDIYGYINLGESGSIVLNGEKQYMRKALKEYYPMSVYYGGYNEMSVLDDTIPNLGPGAWLAPGSWVAEYPDNRNMKIAWAFGNTATAKKEYDVSEYTYTGIPEGYRFPGRVLTGFSYVNSPIFIKQ